MSRLDIMTPSRSQTVIDGLYRDVERRIASSPPGLCPVDLALSFLRLCHAQTCGKCVPCRIGLGQLATLLEQVLDAHRYHGDHRSIIERTARVISDSADCAIGREAARLVSDGRRGASGMTMRSTYCTRPLPRRNAAPRALRGSLPRPVWIYPAMWLLSRAAATRTQSGLSARTIPSPPPALTYASIPARPSCRRRMVDDAVNICGLKRYAVDHAGDDAQPRQMPSPTGKTVAVIGGGPGGLSAAYYLSLMGHKVTVFEQRSKLGGMLRYGIPAYRLPKGNTG